MNNFFCISAKPNSNAPRYSETGFKSVTTESNGKFFLRKVLIGFQVYFAGFFHCNEIICYYFCISVKANSDSLCYSKLDQKSVTSGKFFFTQF